MAIEQLQQRTTRAPQGRRPTPLVDRPSLRKLHPSIGSPCRSSTHQPGQRRWLGVRGQECSVTRCRLDAVMLVTDHSPGLDPAANPRRVSWKTLSSKDYWIVNCAQAFDAAIRLIIVLLRDTQPRSLGRSTRYARRCGLLKTLRRLQELACAEALAVQLHAYVPTCSGS
jgi:hypothetical protein